MTAIMEIPRIMYHGTTEDNAFKIKDQGIKRNTSGIVFLADTEEDARKFAAFHAMIPKGIKEEDSDEVIQAAIPNAIVVFAVDMRQLNPTLVTISDDHSADFWDLKGEAYIYAGKVPSGAIIGANVFERKKPEQRAVTAGKKSKGVRKHA